MIRPRLSRDINSLKAGLYPKTTMQSVKTHVHINPSPLLPLALSLHNKAFQARERGDYATAERLWIEVLAIKDAHTPGGPDSEGSALTRNAMGELYFRMGRYDDAEMMLTKAVSVREKVGTTFDAAVSRENLAQVYEHKGKMALAKETRVSNPNHMVCGNYNVCICIVRWESS